MKRKKNSPLFSFWTFLFVLILFELIGVMLSFLKSFYFMFTIASIYFYEEDFFRREVEHEGGKMWSYVLRVCLSDSYLESYLNDFSMKSQRSLLKIWSRKPSTRLWIMKRCRFATKRKEFQEILLNLKS